MADDMGLMQLMYGIAHAVNSSLDLNTTLQSVLRAIQESLDVRAVVIRLLNADATELQVAAHVGVSDGFLKNVRTKITPGSVHEHVLSGKTVHVENLAAAGTGEPAREGHDLTDEQLHMEQLGGFLAIPLAVRERVFGSLDIYCTAGCGFSDTAVTVLHASADLAAIAIENARLHSALFRIAAALTSTLELQPLLKQVLESTVMEMNLKAASVRLVDKKRQKLELVASHGLSESYLAKGAVSLERSRIDQRVLAGETVILYDVAGEEGFQYQAEARAEGIRSVLAVPLRVKETPVGVMRVYSAQPRHFTQVGVHFLQSVAGLVAVAIENARLYEALQARYEGLKVEVSEWRRFLSLG
jgi:GAF domain-containing protein